VLRHVQFTKKKKETNRLLLFVGKERNLFMENKAQQQQQKL